MTGITAVCNSVYPMVPGRAQQLFVYAQQRSNQAATNLTSAPSCPCLPRPANHGHEQLGPKLASAAALSTVQFLGETLVVDGEEFRASEVFSRAVGINEVLYGPDSPRGVESSTSLGLSLLRQVNWGEEQDGRPYCSASSSSINSSVQHAGLSRCSWCCIRPLHSS